MKADSRNASMITSKCNRTAKKKSVNEPLKIPKTDTHIICKQGEIQIAVVNSFIEITVGYNGIFALTVSDNAGRQIHSISEIPFFRGTNTILLSNLVSTPGQFFFTIADEHAIRIVHAKLNL